MLVYEFLDSKEPQKLKHSDHLLQFTPPSKKVLGIVSSHDIRIFLSPTPSLGFLFQRPKPNHDILAVPKMIPIFIFNPDRSLRLRLLQLHQIHNTTSEYAIFSVGTTSLRKLVTNHSVSHCVCESDYFDAHIVRIRHDMSHILVGI